MLHNDEHLWVNLYIPGKFNWREKGLSLRQETLLSEGEKVNFTISTIIFLTSPLPGLGHGRVFPVVKDTSPQLTAAKLGQAHQRGNRGRGRPAIGLS